MTASSARAEQAPSHTTDSNIGAFCCKCTLFLTVPVVLAFVVWQILKPEQPEVCYRNYSEALVCRLECPKGQFSLPWMSACVPWLTNRDIDSTDFRVIEHIGNGAVKMVYLAEWNGHKVALNTLINPDYQDDFLHGMKMMISLQGSQHVTQFVGRCKNGYLTEYHALGSAENLENLLRDELSRYATVKEMLSLCVQYARAIHMLHTSPIGTRVMCDSNDLRKTLDQYLLRDDLTLIVNDLDALPEVNKTAGRLVKCGHRAIFGEFPAPEQIWPFENREFDDDRMIPYDEKTDIWKIPSVCEHFLSQAPGHEPILFHLFKIHKKCKLKRAPERPSALEVLQEYQRVMNEIISS